MLEYDRIDISEGIDLTSVKKYLRDVVYVNFISF